MANDICLTLGKCIFLHTTVPHVVLISFRWKLLLKNILHYLVHQALLFIIVIILIPASVLLICGRGWLLIAYLFNYVNTFWNMSFRKTNQKWNWNNININYRYYILLIIWKSLHYYIVNIWILNYVPDYQWIFKCYSHQPYKTLCKLLKNNIYVKWN